MEKDTVEVPDNVLIRCPKVNFDLARVAKCSECPNFKGLLDRFPDGETPFAKRYLAQCNAEPVKRELFQLSE